jgi:hypothetical protein
MDSGMIAIDSGMIAIDSGMIAIDSERSMILITYYLTNIVAHMLKVYSSSRDGVSHW